MSCIKARPETGCVFDRGSWVTETSRTGGHWTLRLVSLLVVRSQASVRDDDNHELPQAILPQSSVLWRLCAADLQEPWGPRARSTCTACSQLESKARRCCERGLRSTNMEHILGASIRRLGAQSARSKANGVWRSRVKNAQCDQLRPFHSSLCTRKVIPYMLADIGEGIISHPQARGMNLLDQALPSVRSSTGLSSPEVECNSSTLYVKCSRTRLQLKYVKLCSTRFGSFG
jgi:hypothetical protein